MNRPFKEESKNYSSKTVAQTPYQRAKQAWDNRLGSAHVQSKNWRLAALISGVVAIILAFLLIVAVMNMRPRLFVAEVTTGGKVVNVQPLERSFTPNMAQEQYFLANFIKLIRGVPLDPVVAKKNWISAYYFLSQRGATMLNDYWKTNSPTQMLGKRTVTVEINSINQISNHTFDISWTETVVALNGKQIAKKNFSGVFTIAISPPKTQEQILQNPLGLYITNFNISTEKRSVSKEKQSTEKK